MHNKIRYHQYRFFRISLGLFAFFHFLHLLPWCSEIFSNQGLITDATFSPLMGILPNPLLWLDNPVSVVMLVVLSIIASIGLMVGKFDRVATIFLTISFAWLLQRNPLIANPSLPMMGWMLLFHAFVPSLKTHKNVAEKIIVMRDWHLPAALFIAAWVMLAIVYTHSGYTKLLSPSWLDGDTIRIVLQNPLARDTWWREFLLSTPPIVLKLLTWTVLYIELLFILLTLLKPTRIFAWSVMLAVQFGFLTCLNFADLTIPMFLFHFLTFDPAWLPSRKTKTQKILFYDGVCGFCHRFVSFVLVNDSHLNFVYAPLQGETSMQIFKQLNKTVSTHSMVVYSEQGDLKYKSNAVIYILRQLGGIWKILSYIIWAIPKPVRDLGYDMVGSIRRKLYKTPDNLCPIIIDPKIMTLFKV